MSLSRSFDAFSYRLNVLLRRLLVSTTEFSNLFKKRDLWLSVSLTNDQENRIQEFFKSHYGRHISSKWHRLYQSYTGVFCVDYFPEILFSTKLEPKLNNYREANLLGDKNFLSVLFDSCKNQLYIPATYASCVRGIHRSENDGEIVTKKRIVEALADCGKCIIKKTVDTSSGRDITICQFNNGICALSNRTVEDVLEEYGDNWVVQEFVLQSERLAKLNESSVNTFRVITYICDKKIYSCPVALRLGRSNADRDNIHYGGISIGVQENGCLREEAFSEYGERFKSHPDSHVVFKDYCVLPNGLNQLKSCAERMHARVPWLGIISWDLTIDKKGRVNVIEMNTIGQSAWFCQMVNGEPLFGDNTPKMLSLIK